jgi:hypothetical protein
LWYLINITASATFAVMPAVDFIRKLIMFFSVGKDAAGITIEPMLAVVGTLEYVVSIVISEPLTVSPVV